ncbi:hypothetical protein VP01_2032g3 [Puccinia sorghi]|uniref:Uncharacterized protein n=1 Tax=Puccinia sorghi TaxID=27349 RepID=A0A0L6VB38_9BASI|nr:hypothetical protein VP01_2032g3 [Puccinia sorghi]
MPNNHSPHEISCNQQNINTPFECEPIIPTKPTIMMMKLMLVLENSFESVSNVLEGIKLQSGLTHGNLTESLRSLRQPNYLPKESFSNCFKILGALHILWNISQSIFYCTLVTIQIQQIWVPGICFWLLVFHLIDQQTRKIFP